MYYLATSPEGTLRNASGIAAPGQNLQAIFAPKPVITHPLAAATSVARAFAVAHVKWPCRIFVVEGEPSEERAPGIYSFNELKVISEVDIWQALEAEHGFDTKTLKKVLDKIGNLRVEDVQLVSTVDEDFINQNPDADPELSPLAQAYDAAHLMINEDELGGMRDKLYYFCKAEVDGLCDYFFHYTAMSDMTHPYQLIKRGLDNAAYGALTALLSPGLDSDSYDILVEDYRRIAGESL